MSQSYSDLLPAAVTAARAAGELIRRTWDEPHAFELKGVVNLVTATDRASEALILEHLRAATPSFDILAEESGHHAQGSPLCWVIDPIDGTTNYAHHFPYIAISIGLEENGESVLGVVYDPIYDQLFTATRGGGAFRNGAPIRVSETGTVGSGVIASGLSYDVWETNRGVDEIGRMIRHARSVRINGCAALDFANVACGRLDAYCDTGLSPWDISAGRLLIAEAGGTIRTYGDTTQVDHLYCIASNGRVQEELEGLLVAQ